MSENLSTKISLADSELQQETDVHPWSERIRVISEHSKDNLNHILSSGLIRYELNAIGENSEIGPGDEAELEEISDTLGVTINCSSSKIPELISNNGYHSSLTRPGVVRRLLSRAVAYNRERKSTERAIGIEPSGELTDPEIVFGAAVHDTEKDFFFGGTGGEYGDTIIILDNERIKERTTFTLGDSLGQGAHDIVTWDSAAPLKLIRERFVKKGSNSPIARFVEAQISGGISLEDIQEIRFMANNEQELQSILASIGGRELIASKAPHIKVSYTGEPPGQLKSNGWRPHHPQVLPNN